MSDPGPSVSGPLAGRLDADEERAAAAERELALGALIISNMAEGVCLVRASDAVIVYANPMFEAMFGYGPGELDGLPVAVVNYGGDEAGGAEATAARILAALEEHGEATVEVHNVRKDGTPFWCQSRVSGFDHPVHGLVWVAVQQDVTDLKAARAELEASYERERRAAERLRELDRIRNTFVAVVAHDFRTPLAVIDGFAEVLHSHWGQLDDERRLDQLRRIRENVAVAFRLVDDVLQVARIDSGDLVCERAPFDLGALVEECAAAFGREDQLVVASVPPGLPNAVGDAGRQLQVLGNLLANALRFSPPGAVVRVEVARAGGELEVRVVDRGPGIPEGELDRLFVKFSDLATPRRRASGESGLGLAISRGLVEAQGGRIWYEDTPGGGATFAYTVPVAP